MAKSDAVARMNRALREGRDPADIEAEEEMQALAANASLNFAQILPDTMQIVQVSEFDDELAENQRIFELYHRLVAVGAVQGDVSDATLASMVIVPSTGRPISVSRFREVFGEYLEHAAGAMKVKVGARLFETAMGNEKGDAVRAQIAILERKGGWTKKSEVKTEVSIEARLEVQQKIEETKKATFAFLDELTDAKRSLKVETTKTSKAIGQIEEAAVIDTMVPRFKDRERPPEIER